MVERILMSSDIQKKYIGHNIMNKNVRRNVNYLTPLTQRVKDNEIQDKLTEIIGLRADRKISQVQTAENIIFDFVRNSDAFDAII